ncbi:MAG: deaminase [Patescibacteria group bacterium]|jgi:deoxycytidylate deaminase
MPGIIYPYLPEGRSICYVGPDRLFMALAKVYAQRHSLDRVMPNAAVLVKGSRIIGIGANGSDYHDLHGCRRVELKCRSGEGYELCDGCHPRNHGEAKALQSAHSHGHDPRGADLYLWGHWWCCEPCWKLMEAAGIRDVCLLQDSETLFNREHPDNIVDRQFI